MPINKDFKKLVRARMSKTGEAYTAARANLVRKSAATTELASTAPPAPATKDYAALADMSDAAVKRSTGHTWPEWVDLLDRAGAPAWSHREIADYVHTSHGVREWWTQTVTVGYERIKGLRAIGQRMSGVFEATKSKTIAASAATVYRAFADPKLRRKWLTTKVTVRKATPGRSVRMTWDDGTSVEVWLTPKGAAKTATAVAHRKLKDKADVERRKQYWSERLSVLTDILEDARE